MARITVEDCLQFVDNRFDLVLLATKRARQLAEGVDPLLPWDHDKPTVMALREIAAGVLTPAKLAELEEIRRKEHERKEAERALELALAEELGSEL